MEIGLVQRIDIDNEMQQAYLDYAMSVIVARALPDARDGLKPVHRRILYAMYDMGIRPDSAYKKSARIVGEVLGKYHPHGDAAVYEAMARMAQDFSMRYLLVDGQGNFGSVDGDAPAAMRYTEARLAAPANQMLTDIQKNTVDFSSNFDGTLVEPDVLPAAVPNLLVNGATGIAVGMATSIPPHNLGEVVDALHFMLTNWEKLDDLNVEDLMNFVHGPDFPTGGIIIQEEESDGLISAYSTGRGRVTVQASAHLEEMERGRNRIIITELPYMTNKSSLIERIASLVREERLEGIADLRDESDRQGMRIVIELNKAAEPETVLSELYKSTPMQSTFSIIMLALVDGEPRLLSLKQSLRVFIEHRLEIVRRRSEFDLEKARQRAHILEGYLIALRNLDEVITLIRKSPDAETARDRLIKRFKLSIIQAQAILDMPLRRLAALERKKIEEEYKEVQALIKDLTALLRSPKKMREVIDQELQAVKEAFGDRRRTHIAHLKAGVSKVSMLTAADLKPDKQIWVAISTDGLIARSHDDHPPAIENTEAPLFMIQANTRDTLYLVSEQGEAAAIAVHTLPEAADLHSGLAVYKATALKDGQKVTALFSLPPKERRSEGNEEGYVLTVTRQGMLKKSALAELPGPAAGTFTLAKVNPGDELHWVRLTGGADELVLVSAQGMAIRFSEQDIRPMGLAAAGVMGMKLQENDELVGAELVNPKKELFLLASDGNAKRIAFDQFSRQGRYGQGMIAWKLAPKTQIGGAASGSAGTGCWVHRTKSAPKFIRLDQAPLATRTARGHSVMDLKGEDQVASLCLLEGLGAVQEAAPGKRSKSSGPVESGGGSSKAKAKGEPAKPASKPATKTTTDKAASSSQKTATPPTKLPAAPTEPGKAASKPATKATTGKETPASQKTATPVAKSTSAPTGSGKPASKPATKTPTSKTTPASLKTATSVAKSPAAPAESGKAASKPATKAPTSKTTPTSQKTATPVAKTTAAPAESRKTASKPATKATTGKATPAGQNTATPAAKTPAAPAKSTPKTKSTPVQAPSGEQMALPLAEPKPGAQNSAPAVKKSGAKAVEKPAPPAQAPSKTEKAPAPKKTTAKKTGAS